MYKLNPLLESNSKRDERRKGAFLGLGAYGLLASGGYGIKNNLDKITGIETRFHNTPTRVADQVLDQGILGKYASDSNNLTNTILGDRAKKQGTDNLVYLSKNKLGADTVGRNRFTKGIDSSRGKTLKVKIPYDEYLKLKKVSNPELLGAKNFEEYFKRLMSDPSVIKKIQHNMSFLPMKEKNKVKKFLETGNFEDLPSAIKKMSKIAYKQNYNIVGKNTDTIKGNISPEFIKGSQHFRKNMGRSNFLNYIKKHPGRFSKGIAGAGLSVGALGGGVYLGKKAYNSNKK